MAKKKTFEQAINRLEEIISIMESSDTSLEQSVKLYKEGIELSVFCGESLNKIEQEVTILQQNTQGIFKQKTFNISEE